MVIGDIEERSLEMRPVVRGEVFQPCGPAGIEPRKFFRNHIGQRAPIAPQVFDRCAGKQSAEQPHAVAAERVAENKCAYATEEVAFGGGEPGGHGASSLCIQCTSSERQMYRGSSWEFGSIFTICIVISSLRTCLPLA